MNPPTNFTKIVGKTQRWTAAKDAAQALRERRPGATRKIERLDTEVESLELSKDEAAVYARGQLALEFDAHFARRALLLIESAQASGASANALTAMGRSFQSPFGTDVNAAASARSAFMDHYCQKYINGMSRAGEGYLSPESLLNSLNRLAMP